MGKGRKPNLLKLVTEHDFILRSVKLPKPGHQAVTPIDHPVTELSDELLCLLTDRTRDQLASLRYPVYIVANGPAAYQLESLDGLQLIPEHALKELDVCDNQLVSLDVIARFPALKRLMAAGNQISQVQLMFPRLVYLSLSENRLVTMPDLAGLPNLLDLDLSHNAISDSPFPQLLKPRKLISADLTFNNIDMPIEEFVSALACMYEAKTLRDLRLADNPVATLDTYRLEVLFAMPKLRSLDATSIARVERKQSSVSSRGSAERRAGKSSSRRSLTSLFRSPSSRRSSTASSSAVTSPASPTSPAPTTSATTDGAIPAAVAAPVDTSDPAADSQPQVVTSTQPAPSFAPMPVGSRSGSVAAAGATSSRSGSAAAGGASSSRRTSFASSTRSRKSGLGAPAAPQSSATASVPPLPPIQFHFSSMQTLLLEAYDKTDQSADALSQIAAEVQRLSSIPPSRRRIVYKGDIVETVARFTDQLVELASSRASHTRVLVMDVLVAMLCVYDSEMARQAVSRLEHLLVTEPLVYQRPIWAALARFVIPSILDRTTATTTTIDARERTSLVYQLSLVSPGIGPAVWPLVPMLVIALRTALPSPGSEVLGLLALAASSSARADKAPVSRHLNESNAATRLSLLLSDEFSHPDHVLRLADPTRVRHIVELLDACASDGAASLVDLHIHQLKLHQAVRDKILLVLRGDGEDAVRHAVTWLPSAAAYLARLLRCSNDVLAVLTDQELVQPLIDRITSTQVDAMTVGFVAGAVGVLTELVSVRAFADEHAAMLTEQSQLLPVLLTLMQEDKLISFTDTSLGDLNAAVPHHVETLSLLRYGLRLIDALPHHLDTRDIRSAIFAALEVIDPSVTLAAMTALFHHVRSCVDDSSTVSWFAQSHLVLVCDVLTRCLAAPHPSACTLVLPHVWRLLRLLLAAEHHHLDTSVLPSCATLLDFIHAAVSSVQPGADLPFSRHEVRSLNAAISELVTFLSAIGAGSPDVWRAGYDELSSSPSVLKAFQSVLLAEDHHTSPGDASAERIAAAVAIPTPAISTHASTVMSRAGTDDSLVVSHSGSGSEAGASQTSAAATTVVEQASDWFDDEHAQVVDEAEAAEARAAVPVQPFASASLVSSLAIQPTLLEQVPLLSSIPRMVMLFSRVELDGPIAQRLLRQIDALLQGQHAVIADAVGEQALWEPRDTSGDDSMAVVQRIQHHKSLEECSALETMLRILQLTRPGHGGNLRTPGVASAWPWRGDSVPTVMAVCRTCSDISESVASADRAALIAHMAKVDPSFKVAGSTASSGKASAVASDDDVSDDDEGGAGADDDDDDDDDGGAGAGAGAGDAGYDVSDGRSQGSGDDEDSTGMQKRPGKPANGDVDRRRVDFQRSSAAKVIMSDVATPKRNGPPQRVQAEVGMARPADNLIKASWDAYNLLAKTPVSVEAVVGTKTSQVRLASGGGGPTSMMSPLTASIQQSLEHHASSPVRRLPPAPGMRPGLAADVVRQAKAEGQKRWAVDPSLISPSPSPALPAMRGANRFVRLHESYQYQQDSRPASIRTGGDTSFVSAAGDGGGGGSATAPAVLNDADTASAVLSTRGALCVLLATVAQHPVSTAVYVRNTLRTASVVRLLADVAASCFATDTHGAGADEVRRCWSTGALAMTLMQRILLLPPQPLSEPLPSLHLVVVAADLVKHCLALVDAWLAQRRPVDSLRHDMLVHACASLWLAVVAVVRRLDFASWHSTLADLEREAASPTSQTGRHATAASAAQDEPLGTLGGCDPEDTQPRRLFAASDGAGGGASDDPASGSELEISALAMPVRKPASDNRLGGGLRALFSSAASPGAARASGPPPSVLLAKGNLTQYVLSQPGLTSTFLLRCASAVLRLLCPVSMFPVLLRYAFFDALRASIHGRCLVVSSAHQVQDAARTASTQALACAMAYASKDVQYAYYEHINRLEVIERAPLRQSWLASLVRQVDILSYSRALQDHLTRCGVIRTPSDPSDAMPSVLVAAGHNPHQVFSQACQTERVDLAVWLTVLRGPSIGWNKSGARERLLVLSNTTLYLLRAPSQTPCSVCPPERFCPAGPILQDRVRYQDVRRIVFDYFRQRVRFWVSASGIGGVGTRTVAFAFAHSSSDLMERIVQMLGAACSLYGVEVEPDTSTPLLLNRALLTPSTETVLLASAVVKQGPMGAPAPRLLVLSSTCLYSFVEDPAYWLQRTSSAAGKLLRLTSHHTLDQLRFLELHTMHPEPRLVVHLSADLSNWFVLVFGDDMTRHAWQRALLAGAPDCIPLPTERSKQRLRQQQRRVLR